MVSVGTIVWLSSELMFFAGLFAMYFTARAQAGGDWPPQPTELNLALAVPVTLVLIASSFTCQMGVFSAERGDVFGLRRWYFITFLMGAFFVGGQAYEYVHLVQHGTTIPGSAYGTVFYLATGFHGLHVIGGLIAFGPVGLFLGPVVLGLLWLLLTRTRWGTLVRAATQDREMVGALGVNQAGLFTGVFALGALLAGLGGALQLPREPANLDLDLHTIGAAFVIVVVGGMGSIPGAFVAALLVAELKAVCVWIGLVQVFGIEISFSKLTLVVEFLVMAVVLIVRPWGLLGKAQAPSRHAAAAEAPLPARARSGKARLKSRRIPAGGRTVRGGDAGLVHRGGDINWF